MIKINPNQLHRFKKTRCEYWYMVSKGIYLAFDIDSLEYIGIELFYLPHDPKLIDKVCNDKLNDLISKDILIVI
jgi:hypothetical protein